jgi:hypothetical protein
MKNEKWSGATVAFSFLIFRPVAFSLYLGIVDANQGACRRYRFPEANQDTFVDVIRSANHMTSLPGACQTKASGNGVEPEGSV